MTLQIIDGDFTVCQPADLGSVRTDGKFWCLSKTDEELSLVCPTDQMPKHCVQSESGWRMFRVKGTLDFSLTGILSRISGVLAQAHVGIFAVSTYNTDYILVKRADLRRALAALRSAGYSIEGDNP